MTEIHIGIGEFKVSDNKDDILKTTVGSCIAIALFDLEKTVGGLAHIMLPENTEGDKKIGKYADTAIDELLNIMIYKYGASLQRITAKIAGGANMFKCTGTATPVITIGDNNIKAVKSILQSKKIVLLGSDLEKNYARVLTFFIGNGKLKVSTSCNKIIAL